MGIFDFITALASCLCGPKQQEQGQPQQPEVHQLPSRPSGQQQPQQVPSPYYPPPQQQPHHRPQQQGTYPQQVPSPYVPPAAPHQQPAHQQPAHHKPPKGQSYAHAQPQQPPPPRVDPNQANQANPYYTALRARANAAGDAMARAFEDSHAAYAAGDGARAKELSNAGKAQQAEMERLNDEASAWIFRENNTDSKPGEVDLHGLYVKEAIKYADQSIQDARRRGDSELHFIVGKGLHSRNGAAKLKPAIEELIQKHNLVATLDPGNGGVLVVQLNGDAARQRERGGVLLGADEITRRVQKGEDGCVIM